jgi:hypothetical protein
MTNRKSRHYKIGKKSMKELVLIMNEIMVVKFDLFSGYVINN